MDYSRELKAVANLAGIPHRDLTRAMADRANWAKYVTDEQTGRLANTIRNFAAVINDLAVIAEWWHQINQRKKDSTSQ